MKTISTEFLKRKAVSPYYLKIFEKIFGESVEITEANCLKAVEAGLDLTWIARNLFSTSIYNDYEKIVQSMQNDYNNIIVTAKDIYNKEKVIAFCNAWNEQYRDDHDYEQLRLKNASEEFKDLVSSAISSVNKWPSWKAQTPNKSKK